MDCQNACQKECQMECQNVAIVKCRYGWLKRAQNRHQHNVCDCMYIYICIYTYICTLHIEVMHKIGWQWKTCPIKAVCIYIYIYTHSPVNWPSRGVSPTMNLPQIAHERFTTEMERGYVGWPCSSDVWNWPLVNSLHPTKIWNLPGPKLNRYWMYLWM